MSVLIVDYGMSNLGSIQRSLEECGADAFISADPRDIRHASRIVLPGVGAFADGMANLHSAKWVDALRVAAIEERIPLLGICLGMQLLADRGFEGGETAGLGLVPGRVIRLEPDSSTMRIPHVGWNEVYPSITNPLLADIENGSDFYFVHSYHLVPDDSRVVLATTPYCNTFVSAVFSVNVFGVQFHPEKSGRPGFQLLRNFLNV